MAYFSPLISTSLYRPCNVAVFFHIAYGAIISSVVPLSRGPDTISVLLLLETRLSTMVPALQSRWPPPLASAIPASSWLGTGRKQTSWRLTHSHQWIAGHSPGPFLLSAPHFSSVI